MRVGGVFQALARRARGRPLEGGKALWERVAGPLVSGLSDVAGVLRAMVEIAARLVLAVAERAGAAVLAVWRATVPVLQALSSAATRALRLAERELTPVRMLIAISCVALAVIAIAEFADYRAVNVGAPDYSGKEAVVDAPPVEERTAGSAHSNLLLPVVLIGAVILVLSVRGRWQLARLLSVLGLAVVAVNLLNDLPRGLDEGDAAIEYQGAEATLLGPFWAQLAAGVVLVGCGVMLATRLRDQEAGRAREVGRGPRRGPTGIVAGEGGAGAGAGT